MSCVNERKNPGAKTGTTGQSSPGSGETPAEYESVLSEWAKTWLPVISLAISLIVLIKS